MPHEPKALCVAAIGSMTLCVKAQRILLSGGIKAEVVSLLPEETRRGCAYGVAFPRASESEAKALLRRANISVTQYFTKGEKGV